MDRTDVVILVNSTPKYYYILNFFFGMLRRYAPKLKWDIVLATEDVNNTVCKLVEDRHGAILLELPVESSGFLDSRMKALEMLKATGKYKYCLPLQDDFILERYIDEAKINELFKYFEEDSSLVSARLMPCPGPSSQIEEYPFWALISSKDTYKFVFQATLWKLDACLEWYTVICDVLEQNAPKNSLTSTEAYRFSIELKNNIAENSVGQSYFKNWTIKMNYKHIAWIRRGSWSNAVYLSPFPYRPTAIVRGRLEVWALELAKREGFFLEGN